MTLYKKLTLHIDEALVHIKRIESVLRRLNTITPLKSEVFEQLTSEDKDKLDVLVFRFAKLQDLLGTKIFREYLEIVQYPTEDKTFLELLKELDKEKIIDIDRWSEFRGIRNAISHDYPLDNEEKIEAVNYLISNIHYLVNVTNKIKANIETAR